MEFRKLIIGVFIAAVLIGCATAYQKNGITGGYSEKKLSDSAYYVYFNGNGYATKERVHIFWLYRCAELTVERGYDLMVLRPGQTTTDVGSPAASPIRPVSFNPHVEYAVKSAVWHPDVDTNVKAENVAYTYYSYSTTITTWSSKGTVLMYHFPLPDELVWAIDAKKFMAQLKPYIDSNGGIAAPKDTYAAMNSLVAHESVTLPEGNIPMVAGANSDTRPLRNSRDILDQFRDSLIGFHGLFHERKRLEGVTSRGTVVLGFTVTSNGPVSECHVVSTTFKSPDFVEAIRRAVLSMTFPPKDVATTTVSSFSISFEPLASVPI